MGFDIVAKQIMMLAILILLGFVGVKTKYIQPDLKDSISKIILKFTLPLLNLTSITGQTLRPEMLTNAGILILFALGSIGLMLCVGTLVSKLFRLPPATKTIHTCMSAFGNVIFLGYPLIEALYGQEGLFYAVVYALLNDGIVWTIGVYLIAKSAGSNSKANWKKLINPNTIAFAVALIMLICGVRLPNLLHDTLASVGKMTTNLSMLFIGITLATIPLKGIYKRITVYFIVIVKMILVPIALMFIFSYLPFFDKTMVGVLILQTAMPVQTILTVIASEFGSDYRYATECVFITTVLSLITLPGMYFIMTQIIK